jgi:hypothetical protein
MPVSSIPIERGDIAIGEVAETTEEAQQFVNEGWTKCETPGCYFYASPEGIDWLAERQNNDYRCPSCGRVQKLLEGWDLENDKTQAARVGIELSEMGKLGESAVYYSAARTPEWLERYGEIIWWQPGISSLVSGGALDQGSFDGFSRAPDGTIWAIEVKAANVDNADPSFNIHNLDRDAKHDYAANFGTYEPDLAKEFGVESRNKVPEAQRDYTPAQIRRRRKQAELFSERPSGALQSHAYDRGDNDVDAILAVLPVFDFNNSTVDIYVKEVPLSGHQGKARSKDSMYYGLVKFRATEEYRLLERIPFQNPFMNPHDNDHLIVTPEQMYQFRPPTREELTFADQSFDSGDEVWKKDDLPF